MTSRREFLRYAAKGLTGAALSLAAIGIIDPLRLFASAGRNAKVRWAFLVDTYKCVGCGLCVKACKTENETPYDANVTRTWVERYVRMKDGRVMGDTPKGARDGFISGKMNLGRGKYQEIDSGSIDKAFFVPKLCNQCDNPPCVQVCPVGATYQAEDGVVLVDREWCIGCGYCIMACPYGVRFFHPVHHVAEKCNFCYHRINRGMKPACVDACPFGARQIADIMNPVDPVTRIISTKRVGVLKSEYGTKPQAYYIGLDEEVR